MTDTDRTEQHVLDRRATQARPARHRRLRSPLKVLVLLLAAGFFCLPAAGYLAGVRAHQIENRPLSKRPALSEGWGVFGHLNQWTSDHLPFRDKAVRLNADVDQTVFDEPPAFATDGRPVVIPSKGGWLFYAQELQGACSPLASTATIQRNANRLARMVTATGARYALFVPPDKTSIETAELPARYPGKACGMAAKQAFWSQMELTPPQGYDDLYRPLRELRAQNRAPIYKSKDTHWAPRAGGLYAEKVVDTAQPGLWEPQAFVPDGKRTVLGDLSPFTGIPADNTFDEFAVRRPGVSAYPQVPYRPGTAGRLGIATYVTTSAPGGAPLYTAQALLVGDSFTGTASPLFAPYFADLVSLSVNAAPDSAKDLAALILSSKVVMIESVERAFATGRAPLFTDAFLDQLQHELDRQGAARQRTAPRP